jgi:putative SOS response-associated peptidase YedK
MCGRYTLSLSVEEIWDDLALEGQPGADVWSQGPEKELVPRYNIAPTQAVPVVTDKSPKKLVMLRWGLIPFWADDPKIGARMLNARAESLADKPAFRDAFQKRRCLVVADGFYEWKREALPRGEKPVKKGAPKTPMYARRLGGGVLTFAGLWAKWRSKEDPEVQILSCTIVTTDAAGAMASVHDRMPAILAPEARSVWLDPAMQPSELEELLMPRDPELEIHAVRPLVNSVKNDGPELIVPAVPAVSST